jgi:RecB family exonuclease
VTLAELLTVTGIVGALLAWVLREWREYNRRRAEAEQQRNAKLDQVVTDVGEIRGALLGGIGNPGMAKRLDDLEEGQMRLGADVDEIKHWMRAQQGRVS